MKRYFKYIKNYWHCFLLGPFFMILEASGEFILPYISANIINEAEKIGKAGSNADLSGIIRSGIYMLIFAVFMLITGVLGAKFAITGASNLAADIRKHTFAKIQKFSFSDIDRFSTGSLITRITNDVTQVQTFTQSLLRGFFRSPVMLLGALFMSFKLNPKLALVVLCVIPILVILMYVLIRISNPRYTRMQEQIDVLNTDIGETVTNERVIKSFVREDYQIEKFKKSNQKLVDRSISALKVMISMMPLYGIIINITTLIVVLVSAKQINVGGMEAGYLAAFITYLTQILMALNFMANIVLEGTRAAASNRRITAVLDSEILLNDDNAAFKDKKVESGDVEFKNVGFRHFKHNKEYVLDDISFKVKGGEFVGVIGSTGSGKSTLISMISRLYDPDTGEILVDGVNVKDYSLYNLREGISVVLQKNTLFSGTIAENLRWGKEDATLEEMRSAAKVACADDFIMSFKNGYDTEVEQGGSNFSGGQKQRLCIARALLKSPKILILDDSTSAVDTATDAAIRREFRTTLPDVTKFVIAQRISSVIDADKLIVIDKGRIAGIGTHEELIKNCEPYIEIYTSQKDMNEEGKAND